MGNCLAFRVSKSAPSPVNRTNAAAIGQIVTPNLKMFTVAELSSATNKFKPDTILGAGGFGTVFKGWVDEETLAPVKVGRGIPVAVKRSTPDSSQGFKEWQSEVKYLGKFNHPNLVKLLGYCLEEREFYLVYEYMQRGSLDSHLFSRGDPLPWDLRLKIAIGAARGIAFLHTTENAVIYRDFKASNILLDWDFNAKLSDFGLAKPGPSDGQSHLTTGIVGTFGYAAPEYVATGHLYVKSDVYGFGVVLLEMMTGRRVLDLNRPTKERNLVEWARPCLADKRKLTKILDQRLEGQIPPNASAQLAQLIVNCLKDDPKTRPSMEDLLKRLEQIHAIKMKPNKSNPTPQTREQPTHHHRRGHHRSPYHHRNGAAGARPDLH